MFITTVRSKKAKKYSFSSKVAAAIITSQIKVLITEKLSIEHQAQAANLNILKAHIMLQP